MALEKEPSFVISLGEIVNTRLQAYSKTVTAIRAKQDADFSSKVAQLGLTYGQQATYYQSRLDAEKNSDYPDESYMETLQSNVDNLNKLARFQNFNTKYQDDFTAYQTGKLDLQSLINETQSAYDSETDPTNKASMLSDLNSLKGQQFTDNQNILKNKITLATTDQSIPTLNDMLGQVQNLQAEALASGDESLASDYQVQAQGVKTNIAQVTIQQKTNNISFAVLNGNLKSGDKLTQLQGLVSGADTTAPVTIAGVQYPSEQAYWTAQQNAYLSGNGSNMFGDITKDLTTEINAKLSVASANSKNGAVPLSDLQGVSDQFTALLNNPAIGQYADRINGVKVAIMSSAVNTYNVPAINAEYTLSGIGGYNKAINDLTQLQTITGINQATNISNIQAQQGVLKEAAAAAFNSSGKTYVAPNVAANPKNSVADIASLEQGGGAPDTSNAKIVPPVGSQPGDKTTTPPATPPVVTPAPTGTSTPSTPKTYSVIGGDTLSAIAAKNKTTVDALVKANKIADPNKIQIGQKLIIQ